MLEKVLVGSDHFSINIRIGMEFPLEEDKIISRWKLNKTNWELFVEIGNMKNKYEQLINEEELNENEYNRRNYM